MTKVARGWDYKSKNSKLEKIINCKTWQTLRKLKEKMQWNHVILHVKLDVKRNQNKRGGGGVKKQNKNALNNVFHLIVFQPTLNN